MPTKGPGDPIGNHYHLGIHQVAFQGPIDAVVDIIVDEDKYLYKHDVDGPEITTSQNIVIDKEELFGGDEREGGISGAMSIALGYNDQEPNTYLQNKIDALVSAYRGVVSLIWKGMYIGNHYFLKTVSVVGRRVHVSNEGVPQWQDDYAEPLPGQMNPVHIIRECLTNQRWGCREPDSKIDETSFLAAAITCYNEGLGFSFLCTDDMETFLKDVIYHMNGRLYEDTDGKYKIKLLRNDYVPVDVPDITQYISNVTEFEHTSVDKLVSSVVIKFWNGSTRKDDQIAVASPGLAQRHGGFRTKTIEFKGVTSKTLATRIGQRELASASVDLPTATIETTRGCEGYNVGDVIRFSWTDPDINNMICRIKDIDLGSLTNNKITIKVVKDVFAAASPAFFENSDSDWVDPVNDPQGVQYGIITETPYYLYAQKFGDEKAQEVNIDKCFVSCAGAAPTSDSIKAVIKVDDGSGYVNRGDMYFCPKAILDDNISPTTTTFDLSSTQMWNLMQVDTFLQIDQELMRIVSFTDTSITVGRGVLDTIPKAHNAGAAILAWQQRNGYVKDTYFVGEQLDIKLLPVTPRGMLKQSLAETNSIEMNNRFHRPYPPGNVKLNGVAFPTSLSGTITLTWSHRDRLAQTTYLVDHTETDIGPETDTLYNIRLYDGETLLRQQLGYAGNSYAVIPNDADPYYNNIANPKIELESVRSGLVSMQKYVLTFAYGA